MRSLPIPYSERRGATSLDWYAPLLSLVLHGGLLTALILWHVFFPPKPLEEAFGQTVSVSLVSADALFPPAPAVEEAPPAEPAAERTPEPPIETIPQPVAPPPPQPTEPVIPKLDPTPMPEPAKEAPKPEPQPKVETPPEPAPQPTPKPPPAMPKKPPPKVVEKTPPPQEKPVELKPEPQPQQRLSRENFLKQIGQAVPATGAASTAARGQGYTTGDFASVIQGRLRGCLQIDPGAGYTNDMQVRIRARLSREGYITAHSIDVTPAFSPYATQWRNVALAAITDPRCQPIQLPREAYSTWQVIDVQFTPRVLLQGY